MSATGLLKAMSIAYTKLQDRKEAHVQLRQQVQKVEEVSNSKASKDSVKLQIDELRRRIEEVVTKERSVVNHVYDDEKVLSGVRQKIDQLERKLDAFIMLSSSYTKRAREIDDRIRQRMRPRHYELLKSQIRKLEESYNSLSSKGEDPARVQALKTRIDELKKKVES